MKKYISVKLQIGNNRPPSDAAVIERSWSLMNESMRAIDLQIRRLRSSEPEDAEFVFRWWVDLQFLIVALRRLRRATELAARVTTAKSVFTDAIAQFDRDLPMLAKMRNVGEHIDDYAVDSKNRRHKDVERFSLQVGSFDGTTYKWLGEDLNIDEAQSVAIRLWEAVRSVVKNLPKDSKN
ncbi:MAG: hypothetical protein COW88_02885 [Candidatus Lloydbacteria bacterium CG22_combo_CG10-13_8_21_14_all_47_15]|uniref:HEPN AbiU2-like domain-containing protein n=1 Tax=Candidatus Lloydbacteria bacterium CG22_combo_CG10-13_8_21_14_all_47_15 TaxID=1974635 RepID=A0A2H0CTQ1_9BACT|nr:MAG: hypothetical protein COW88_02885 [Candidatus Lloydbacteria bacterium CG22_combo_CG10-13_8_21_14_all_47_15]